MPIDPTPADLERWRAADDGRPFVLVQLLRFAEGGRDRYVEYSTRAQPILNRIGAQVIYAGECSEPGAWDGAVLVRYPSRGAYVAMVESAEYQAIAGVRRASLREAVFLPMSDWAGR